MNKNTVKAVLLQGGCLEFGRLSICPLDRYYRYGQSNQYQVHCDDVRFLYSGLHDLDKAVYMFIKIGRETDAFNYKKSNKSMPKVQPVQDDAYGFGTSVGARKPQRKNRSGGGSARRG